MAGNFLRRTIGLGQDQKQDLKNS